MSDEKKGGIDSFGIGFSSDGAPARVADAVSAGRIDARVRQEAAVPEAAPDEQERAVLRIVVLAELAPTAEHALRPRPATPVRVRRGAVDEAVSAIDPSFAIDVDHPVTRKKVRVDLAIDSLRALRPAGLAKAADPLRALLEMRAAMLEGARARAVSAADRHGFRELIVDAPAAVPAALPAPAATGRSAIDDLLDRVEVGAPAAAESVSAVAGFVRATSTGGAAQVDVSAIDRAIAQLGRAIVTHPESRRLERTWAGLALLAEHAGEGIEVHALAVARDDVEGALDALAEARDTMPIDLIVVDAQLSPNAADLELLERWAVAAAHVGAPMIAEGTAGFVGLDAITDLASSQRRLRSSDDPRAIVARAFSARDVARSVMLAANRVVLGGTSAPKVDGISLGEPEPLLGNPAWAVAALVARRFAASGWASPITGVTHGALPGVSLEAPMSIDAQAEAAKAGLAVLVPHEGRDAAILLAAPMMHRGKAAKIGGDPSATTTLEDQLFVTRVVRMVDALGAAIPAGTPEDAIVEVAQLAFAEVFGPQGPKVSARASASTLSVTLRPNGFMDVSIEELTLSAPLGGD